VNTGGGGGGAGNNGVFTGAGGAGGKGVVIIRTPNTVAFPTTLTGASVSSPAGFYVFTFNDSGTIKWGA
jgi:hypothetical protein